MFITMPCINPACGTLLRVPTDKGELKLRCPTCGEERIWSPLPDERVLAFRCAKTGERFGVLFARQEAGARYAIRGYSRQPAQPAALTPWRDRALAAARRLPLLAGVLPAKAAREVERRFNIHEFDMTGIHCPCCGYGKDAAAGAFEFIFCERCRAMVCGARIVELAMERVFTCCPQCGVRGSIGGSLTELAATECAAPLPQVHGLPRTAGTALAVGAGGLVRRP